MDRVLNPFMGREAREINKKSPLMERANNTESGWIGKFLTQVAAEGLPFGRGRNNVPESQMDGFKVVFAKVFREFDDKDCLNPLTHRQWRQSFSGAEKYLNRFGADDAVAFTATYSALSTQLLRAQEHRGRDRRNGPPNREEMELESKLSMMTHHIDGAKLFVELARLQEEWNKKPIEAVPVAGIVFEPERTGKPPEKAPPETEKPPVVPVFEPDVGGGTIIPEAVGQLPENTRPGCLSFAVGVGLWGINLGADSILRPRKKVKEVKEPETEEKKKKKRRGGLLAPIPVGCFSLMVGIWGCLGSGLVVDYFLSRDNCQMAGDVSLALKRAGVNLDLRALCPENDRSYDKVEDSRLGRTEREEMPKVPIVSESVEAKVDNDTGGNGADGKIENKQEVEIKKDYREFPILKGDSLTGLMVRYTDTPVEDFMDQKPEAMKAMSDVFMYNWRNNPGFADKYLQLLASHPDGVIAEWGGAKLTSDWIGDAFGETTGVDFNLDILRGGDPNGTYRNEVVNAVAAAGFLPDADAEALMDTMSALEGGLGCTIRLETKWLSADFVQPAKGEPR